MPLPAGHDPALAPSVCGRERVFCCHSATLSGKHPPNSLAAVDECVSARVPRLEIDLRFTADDAMVVYHDARLERETFASGLVAELTRERAKGVRLRADGTTALACLDEVVDVLRGRHTLLQVDLKLMRPMSGPRLAALSSALAPVRGQVLVGSQAHWNLRGLSESGFAVALDPSLHWRHGPGEAGADMPPAHTGVHRMRDDSPIARVASFGECDYFAARVDDLIALVPAAEWMVDHGTLVYLAGRGFQLGDELARRGVALAAWTLHDEGASRSRERLSALFALGATTVITDAAGALARYAARLG